MENHQLSIEKIQKYYGLTLCIIIDMEFMSSGSAAAGFPCSKPPLNPITKASSIRWRLSYIEKTILNQQIQNGDSRPGQILP